MAGTPDVMWSATIVGRASVDAGVRGTSPLRRVRSAPALSAPVWAREPEAEPAQPRGLALAKVPEGWAPVPVPAKDLELGLGLAPVRVPARGLGREGVAAPGRGRGPD